MRSRQHRAATCDSLTAAFTSFTFDLARETFTGGAQRNNTGTGGSNAVSTRFGGGSKYYCILDVLGSTIGLFDKNGAFDGGHSSCSPYC